MMKDVLDLSKQDFDENVQRFRYKGASLSPPEIIDVDLALLWKFSKIRAEISRNVYAQMISRITETINEKEG